MSFGLKRIYINLHKLEFMSILSDVMVQKLKTTQHGQNHSFYITANSIKIKFHENNTPLAITHFNDFEYHFPNADLSPASTSISGS